MGTIAPDSFGLLMAALTSVLPTLGMLFLFCFVFFLLNTRTGEVQAPSLKLSHYFMDSTDPTGQGPNVEVTPITKYFYPNYTLGGWGYYHRVIHKPK